MKFFLLSLSALLIMSFTVHAQRGTTQIAIGAESGIPAGNAAEGTKIGIGGSAKALFGIGNTGQVTFTTGYIAFGGKNLPSGYKATLSIIPFMAGYRQNFNGFYLEPQAGAGIISEKDKFGGESETFSSTKFTWAAGAGYVINNLDLGVRYQSSEFEGGSFGFIGVKVAYNFSLGSK